MYLVFYLYSAREHCGLALYKLINYYYYYHATKFARANTAANCQIVGGWQFSARSSQGVGVCQGCISKILRRNRETGRPHQRKRGGSMKISTPRKTVNCSEWSARTASSRLLVYECRWSADLGARCQFEPFGDGFWPPDIGLGVQLDVLGSLWSTGDAVVNGGGDTKCGISDNGDTVSSVMSPGSTYTTVTVWAGCAVGKGRGWLMPASSLMVEIVANIRY